MKKYYLSHFAIVLLSLAVLSGCSDKNPSIPNSNSLHYFSDMEQYTGFVDGALVIQSAIAHSGKYVAQIDTANPYGIGFKRKLGEISTSKIMKMDVSAFVNANSVPLKCAIVCVIDNSDNVPIYYETFSLEKLLTKTKEWTKVSTTFYFPDSMLASQRIVVYCFNPNSASLYLDDFEINFTTK